MTTPLKTTTIEVPPKGLRTVANDAKHLSFWAENAAPVGLVLLVIVFATLSPTFLTLGNIQAMLIAAAILIILAVAQSYVITTGGIDLSISATMTLGAVGFGLSWQAGLGFWLSALIAIASSGLVGLVNGLLIAKGKVTDFIATLGTLSVATGLALILTSGKPISITSLDLLWLTTGTVWIFGYPFLIAAVIAVISWFVMFRTRFGLHVQAVGGSEEAAVANGVNAQRVRIAVYLMAAMLAGLAAILLVARVGAAEPAINTGYLLNSIAAVVLGGVALTGGRGKIVGPVLGALLLTALTNGLTLLGVSQFYQPLAVGLVVVLAALLTRFQNK
ncbi:ABC transporter permease [Microbacterium sp. zg.B48]|uniref:ABC transporter permease n=1 Tax=unclassified Microbacterium TaxID=2609290 RepID=UPI00214C4C39|nr:MULTISPECIES: ABC transporter permease [unclassified Microbacterium]MCR2762493.1 ABC transporter permease [Microbacterium sp. zg.B48]MCR2810663.1 ABC transporter permease [Microbacterium sp. zg.B185]WIM18200.1 ABC transporter permease [Microbacterium sp. zg-B185]